MNALKIGVDPTTRIKSAAAIPLLRYANRSDEDELMKSAVVKHSVVIGGHKTSISLEEAFWRQLKEIAGAERATVSKLIARIDETREHHNLSSAIRVYILEHVRTSTNGGGESAGQR